MIWLERLADRLIDTGLENTLGWISPVLVLIGLVLLPLQKGNGCSCLTCRQR